MGTNNRPGQSCTYASTSTGNGVAKEHKSEEMANVKSTYYVALARTEIEPAITSLESVDRCMPVYMHVDRTCASH